MAASTRGPVETKVVASTSAAAVAGFVLWVLATYVFGGDVPEPVAVLVAVAVPAVFAFAAGWSARHTPRNDADATR